MALENIRLKVKRRASLIDWVQQANNIIEVILQQQSQQQALHLPAQLHVQHLTEVLQISCLIITYFFLSRITEFITLKLVCTVN